MPSSCRRAAHFSMATVLAAIALVPGVPPPAALAAEDLTTAMRFQN